MKHINDWNNLNEIRNAPDISLIENRIKSNSHAKALELWKNLAQQDIPSLLIEITNICNNHCKYCPINNTNHEIFHLDDLDILIKNLRNKRLSSVWLTGGEPIHDFSRFKEIVEIISYNNIDIEKISTSLFSSSILLEKFVDLINYISRYNKIFKCTVSISINSFLNAKNDITLLKKKIEYIKNNSNEDNVLIHFPILIDDITSNSAIKLGKELANKYSNISISLKSKIPESFGNVVQKEVNRQDFARYMDCASPSLFPCTWSMWHLKANGELFCCSSWFNNTSSKNYLGKIKNKNILHEYSDYMRYIQSHGSWYKAFQEFLEKNEDISQNLVTPDFDDNTNKCFFCHKMMKNFKPKEKC